MNNIVSIKGLSKRYDSGHQALNDISLDVQEGDFFALLGPNGAGKSTTIGILCSLVRKTAGDVRVFDLNIDTHFPEIKANLGIVPQEFNFNTFETVNQIVLAQAGYYGIDRKTAKIKSEKYLKSLGLWGKRDVVSRFLSGGMKRRLMIARALIHEPKLLILDEPSAGVDIELRRSMWDFLKEINANGTTIILTTHYLEEAENLCRNIAIIDQGSIIQNSSMKSLLRELQEETFILDAAPLPNNELTVADYPIRTIDNASFEVKIKKGQGLNDLFAELTQQGITVHSMRNKTNRLEELFVKLIDRNQA